MYCKVFNSYTQRVSDKQYSPENIRSRISWYASKFGISTEPLVSLSLDFYLRGFVKVNKNRHKNVVTDNSMFLSTKNGIIASSVPISNVIPNDENIQTHITKMSDEDDVYKKAKTLKIIKDQTIEY